MTSIRPPDKLTLVVDTIRAPGQSWSASFPIGLAAVEDPSVGDPSNPVGVPPEVAGDAPAAPVRNRRVGIPRRRRNPTHFIRASSPELEKQLWELVAGQIDEIPKPPPGTRRVAFTAPTGWIGEQCFCMQIGTVLANFGYEWCVCSEHIARMVEKVNPDLFISAAASMQIPPPSPKSGITSLIYIHSPFCFSPRGYRHIQTWDNFLFAWTGADQLEERFQASGKRFRRLKTHFTIRKTDFCDSPKERIAFFGSLHDPRRREELAKLFQLLDKTDYCDFYGSARRWQKKKLKSWRGEVPFTGLTDVQDVMRPAGIALLLHSKHHFESGTSVSRDFEALSSSCVIITEKTAFMQENFGDCALFIDTDRPAEETFEQIDTHVKWIHAHPEEAIEMARRSHQIFCDKFSLEGECEKILKFVDEISAAQVQQGDGAVIHT